MQYAENQINRQQLQLSLPLGSDKLEKPQKTCKTPFEVKNEDTISDPFQKEQVNFIMSHVSQL